MSRSSMVLAVVATFAASACAQADMSIYKSDGSVVSVLIAQIDSVKFTDASLIAFYPFSGNANDASGNAHNGTVHGATLTTDRFSQASSAYLFDGTSGYIQTSFPGIAGTAARTVSVWVRASDPGNVSGGYREFFSFGVGASGGMFGCCLISNPGVWGGVSIEGNNTVITYTASVCDSSWHHLAYVVPAIASPRVQDVRIYLDGNLLTTAANSYNPTYAVNTVLGTSSFIGSNEYGTGSFFKGKVDDVRVYSRALTIQEIAALAADKP